MVGGRPPCPSGEADIYGGEAGIELIATRWLSGFANFSYQEVGQNFTGDLHRAVPRFKYNAGLRGEWENGLNAEIAYHYYVLQSIPYHPFFRPFRPLAW